MTTNGEQCKSPGAELADVCYACSWNELVSLNIGSDVQWHATVV